MEKPFNTSMTHIIWTCTCPKENVIKRTSLTDLDNLRLWIIHISTFRETKFLSQNCLGYYISPTGNMMYQKIAKYYNVQCTAN